MPPSVSNRSVLTSTAAPDTASTSRVVSYWPWSSSPRSTSGTGVPSRSTDAPRSSRVRLPSCASTLAPTMPALDSRACSTMRRTAVSTSRTSSASSSRKLGGVTPVRAVSPAATAAPNPGFPSIRAIVEPGRRRPTRSTSGDSPVAAGGVPASTTRASRRGWSWEARPAITTSSDGPGSPATRTASTVAVGGRGAGSVGATAPSDLSETASTDPGP